jgi:hypothetical protein
VHVVYQFGISNSLPSFLRTEAGGVLIWDHMETQETEYYATEETRRLAINIDNVPTSLSLKPDFFAPSVSFGRATLRQYAEIKMVKPQEVWLGFSSKSLFDLSDTPDLQEGDPISDPFLAYNTINGRIMYSSVIDSTGRMVIRSRPYGYPLDTTHSLGMGLTSNRIYFIANTVALPIVSFNSLVGFPAADFVSLMSPSSEQGTITIVITPASRVSLRPFWEGKLLSHHSKLLPCPFVPRSRKLLSHLQEQFSRLKERVPSLIVWLDEVALHYQAQHPRMLPCPSSLTPSSSAHSHHNSPK